MKKMVDQSTQVNMWWCLRCENQIEQSQTESQTVSPGALNGKFTQLSRQSNQPSTEKSDAIEVGKNTDPKSINKNDQSALASTNRSNFHSSDSESSKTSKKSKSKAKSSLKIQTLPSRIMPKRVQSKVVESNVVIRQAEKKSSTIQLESNGNEITRHNVETTVNGHVLLAKVNANADDAKDDSSLAPKIDSIGKYPMTSKEVLVTTKKRNVREKSVHARNANCVDRTTKQNGSAEIGSIQVSFCFKSGI